MAAASAPDALPDQAPDPARDPRWARQLALPEVGPAGQRRLARARVLVVGLGGLGSPVALWLAAAGVGTLVLVDPDVVDATNLHRQLLHAAADLGRPKVASAADRIAAIGAGTRVEAHQAALDAGTADALLAGCDLAIDGTDALAPRYALSDACVRAGVPMVHGSVARWEGRVTVLCGDRARGPAARCPDAPCYRCLWPARDDADEVPSCDAAGVLGVVPGLVGMLQASEALKLLLDAGTPLAGTLWVTDLRDPVTHRIALARDPLCRACGADSIRGAAVAPPGDATAEPAPTSPEPLRVSRPDAAADPSIPEITPEALAARLRSPEPPVLVDVREPWEHDLARIAGARLVPMNSLPAALSTFDPSREYVVHCHHGVRSLMAAQFLKERGLTRVTNLSGGIDAWSTTVDPTVPRY